MEYDIEQINKLFKGTAPRKISIVSRLAGLDNEEIRIMRLKWLEGRSDTQICEILGYSTSKLTRKRRLAYEKIIDSLDLYGLADLKELPIEEIFDYEGLFYQAQDMLILYFLRNNKDRLKQQNIVDYLKWLNK